MVDEKQEFADVLLHIGYHKTGSTWLQDRFFQPENGMTTAMEGNRARIVDDFVTPDNFAYDAAATRDIYRGFVADARAKNCRFVLSHERLSGYPPAGGYDRKLIADRLADTFPGARILIIIREQLSLVRSIYSQSITDGGDLSIDDFLAWPEPRLGRSPCFRPEVYEFHRLIEYYQNLFGKERVLVLPFEMMAREIGEFGNRIADFMQLPSPKSVSNEASNIRRPATMRIAQRLGNRWFSNNEASRGAILHIKRFPRRFATFTPLFRALSPKWLDPWLDGKIERKIHAMLSDSYRLSNAKTAELTGLDLARWGYSLQ